MNFFIEGLNEESIAIYYNSVYRPASNDPVSFNHFKKMVKAYNIKREGELYKFIKEILKEEKQNEKIPTLKEKMKRNALIRERKKEQQLRNRYKLYLEKMNRLGRKPKSYEEWIDYQEARQREDYQNFQRSIMHYNQYETNRRLKNLK